MTSRASCAPPAVDITFNDADPTTYAVDALVVLVPPGVSGDTAWEGPLAAIDAALDGALRTALADQGFNGGLGKTVVLPTLGRLPAKRIIASGLDPQTSKAHDVRRAWGAAAAAARNAGAKTIAGLEPGGALDEAARYRAAVEGALGALYDFPYYRSEHEAKEVDSITFLTAGGDAAQSGVAQGFALASGIYLARDLVFEPGQAIYPETLAAVARDVAREAEQDYVEYDEVQLQEMGAGCIVAVGMGSVHPPRMMHLTHRPSGESKGTIAFIGKGITFDTGGMNLKPTGGIETMKTDMAGSAAVLGAMRALAGLDLPYTVLGIVASAENMPSHSAYRPGDVLTAMNGKTIEILSTDAEGRLVLADAMVYAARNGAEEMIDLATLTGAKMIAIGSESVAVFANDDTFAQAVVAAGTVAGELYWQLPLWDALKRQIRSDIADMKNTGGRPGGAITAALLLAEFAEGLPWVHLDIAGAAWADSARDDCPKGPTGIGVRELINYLEAKAAAEA